MKVIVIGGYDRYGGYLRDYAEKKRLEIKFIDRPRPNMEDIVKKADCVIVLTRLVSHELLRCAKTLVPEKCIYCKQAGLCNIKKLIENFLTNNRN